MKNSLYTSMRTINNAPGRQSGLSLIELMIASVIGLVLLSGVVTIFSSNNASSSMSTGMARVQDSGRVALDIFSYSLRMAGYEGCRDEAKPPVEVFASNPPTIDFPANVIWGASVNAAGIWAPAAHVDLTGTTGIATAAKEGTDVFYVQHGSGRSVTLAEDMGSNAADVVVPSNPDQIATGDLVMISNCFTSNVFRATGVDDAGATVKIGHAGGTLNSQGSFTQAFTGTGERTMNPTRIMRFESQAYYVGDTNRTMPNGDEIYSLFSYDTTESPRKATELIEGVEHMEVLYGENTTANSGTANIRYVTADNVTNWSNIISVQLGLLVATADYAGQSNDDQTYNVAGTLIGPPNGNTAIKHPGDRRIRAAFNTTIQLRNRNL